MRKGDKLKCKEDINDLFGLPLFEKDRIYEVLYIDNESTTIQVCLNHNLNSNEYKSFDIVWINEKFTKVINNVERKK
jgi:hypothetical protein